VILDEIVASKKRELGQTCRDIPMRVVRELAGRARLASDFAGALKGDCVRLIAEVKRASPSRGTIAAAFDPVSVAKTYAQSGAAAISVLTESRFFQGGLGVLDDVRVCLGEGGPPLLRKDFIFDPYQVYEARAHGADALLLIVAILEAGRLKELMELTHDLGMECLVEVHDEAELNTALGTGARVIGLNNRDLSTFSVDLATTERLRPLVPSDRVVVSESGIRTRDDMKRLRGCGVDAVLIGEALMTATDIATRMRELLL
jgi:indole-3-glycerol phosphate synthase